MRTLVFDIETNGIDFGQWNRGDLSSLHTIHCLVYKDLDTGEVHRYTKDGLADGLKEVMDAGRIIGHNITGFDIPAIKHLFPWFEPSGDVYDTRNEAKSSFPEVAGHRLKDWGLRLGVHKGAFGEVTDWSVCTTEMIKYCEQDVVVTSALYSKLTETEA